MVIQIKYTYPHILEDRNRDARRELCDSEKWMREDIILLVGGTARSAGMVIKKLPWLFQLKKKHRRAEKMS